eukprot:4455924-Pleurochrysis_carterae.AAC.1
MVRSSAVAFELPSVSRRESSWARYSVCSDSGADGDVAVAVRRADLLDVRRARDVEQLLLDVRQLAVDATLCGTLRQWVGSLMRRKRAKIRKRAGTWLRETCAVVMASAMA